MPQHGRLIWPEYGLATGVLAVGYFCGIRAVDAMSDHGSRRGYRAIILRIRASPSGFGGHEVVDQCAITARHPGVRPCRICSKDWRGSASPSRHRAILGGLGSRPWRRRCPLRARDAARRVVISPPAHRRSPQRVCRRRRTRTVTTNEGTVVMTESAPRLDNSTDRARPASHHGAPAPDPDTPPPGPEPQPPDPRISSDTRLAPTLTCLRPVGRPRAGLRRGDRV